jgi:hypothetical protein
MRSAGLKNITAKHLGELSPFSPDWTDENSTCISIIIDRRSSYTLHSGIHSPAPQPEASGHVDRI